MQTQRWEAQTENTLSKYCLQHQEWVEIKKKKIK